MGRMIGAAQTLLALPPARDLAGFHSFLWLSEGAAIGKINAAL